jgi:hypothetical protein
LSTIGAGSPISCGFLPFTAPTEPIDRRSQGEAPLWLRRPFHGTGEGHELVVAQRLAARGEPVERVVAESYACELPRRLPEPRTRSLL